MQPLTEDLCDKGIPPTAKPFKRLDGWTCGYLPPSLLHQMLQMDPSANLGNFNAECMAPAFVTHVQNLGNGAMPFFFGFPLPPPSPFSLHSVTRSNLSFI